MKKKIFSILMAVLLVCCFIPAASFADGEEVEDGQTASGMLDVSKSKTATNLDENFESQVTLSLPSAEEELVTDVVFVLDESSCSEPVKDQVRIMLEELYAQVENTNAKVKIGAVQFRGEVTKMPLTGLTESTKTDIAEFMSKRPETGGSNMSAGIIAGEKMLDEDNDVDNSRKYLILVSDGITYIWDDETTELQENYGVNFANGDTPNTPMLAGPDAWDVANEKKFVPESWDTYLSTVESKLEKTIDEKSSLYDRTNATDNKPFVGYSEKDEYACTVDIALYKSYKAYMSASAKYNTYVVAEGVLSDMETFPFGPSFMSYLADGKTYTFEKIVKEIIYLVDNGSTVVDTMGKTEDYDFDFVNVRDKISLTVGGIELDKETISENHYGFGKTDNETYRYELIYYPESETSSEKFEWKINEAIKITNTVQLTYTVRLTNPKDAAGTYGQYDYDGSEGYNGLYTNNSAVLTPVDTNSVQGAPQEFPKPTVSYTVEKETPVTPIVPSYTRLTVQKVWKLDDGGTAADSVKVQLTRNGIPYGEIKTLSAEEGWTADWYVETGYSYDVVELDVPEGFTSSVEKAGYTFTVTNDDVKAAEPEQPDEPAVPDEPDTPDTPDTPDEPQTPNQPEADDADTDAPQTGDAQDMGLWFVLLAVTAGGLGVTLRLSRKQR